MSLAFAVAHPAPLRWAALSARGRDESRATRLLTAIFKQSGIFNFLCDHKTVPTLPLPRRVAREARPVKFVRKGE